MKRLILVAMALSIGSVASAGVFDNTFSDGGVYWAKNPESPVKIIRLNVSNAGAQATFIYQGSADSDVVLTNTVRNLREGMCGWFNSVGCFYGRSIELYKTSAGSIVSLEWNDGSPILVRKGPEGVRVLSSMKLWSEAAAAPLTKRIFTEQGTILLAPTSDPTAIDAGSVAVSEERAEELCQGYFAKSCKQTGYYVSNAAARLLFNPANTKAKGVDY